MNSINWYPTLPDPPPALHYSELLSGIGLPDNSDGENGDLWVNISTGDLYSKVSGLWTILSIGGGTPPQVFSGNYGGGTPTDVPTATAALAYDTGTGAIWQWVGSAWQ